VPNVQWKTPDDGQRNCPKHVEFLDNNKFGKLVRLLVSLKRNYENVGIKILLGSQQQTHGAQTWKQSQKLLVI
jgi:hypothetical protein